MAFNPDQPRIPKGYPGAGRFIKVGAALAPLRTNASRRRELETNPFSRSAQSGPDHKSPFVFGASSGTAAMEARPRPRSRSLQPKTFQTDTGGRISREEAARVMFGDRAADAKLSKPAKPARATAQAKSDVRASVAKHAEGRRSGWVDLADVRDDLAAKGHGREQQDAALKAMLTDPDVRIVPIADKGKISQRDRDAALQVGRGVGSEMHAIQIGGDPHQRQFTVPTESLADLRSDLADAERRLRFSEDEGVDTTLLRAHIAALREKVRAADAPQPKEKTGDGLEAAAELPKLTGSSKQRSWAADIRSRALTAIAGYGPARIGRTPAGRAAEDRVFRRIAARHVDAKWWIDNRSDVLRLLRSEVTTGDQTAIRLKDEAGMVRGERPIVAPAPAASSRGSLGRRPTPAPSAPPPPRSPQRTGGRTAIPADDNALREAYREAADRMATLSEEDRGFAAAAARLADLRRAMDDRGLARGPQPASRPRFGRR